MDSSFGRYLLNRCGQSNVHLWCEFEFSYNTVHWNQDATRRKFAQSSVGTWVVWISSLILFWITPTKVSELDFAPSTRLATT